MSVAEKQVPPPGELCIDHLGHFVPDLNAAAKVFEDVGMVATPISHHQVGGKPAGTSNRCVMFEEGYIEILAPTADTPNARRVRDRMDRFVGLHLACFGTPAAQAEHLRLAAHGFEPEPVVNLERQIEDKSFVRFNVVYIPPAHMPEGRVQYCQHVTPAGVWREGFVNPLRLSALYVAADDPAQAAARWGRFSGLLPHAEGEAVSLRTARGRIVIARPQILAQQIGPVPPAPALAGYELSCRHPAAFLARCTQAGLRVKGNAVSLPAALGGAWVVV
jgi:hypothetical protein